MEGRGDHTRRGEEKIFVDEEREEEEDEVLRRSQEAIPRSGEAVDEGE